MNKYLVTLEFNGVKFGIEFYAYQGNDYAAANVIAAVFKASIYTVENIL